MPCHGEGRTPRQPGTAAVIVCTLSAEDRTIGSGGKLQAIALDPGERWRLHGPRGVLGSCERTQVESPLVLVELLGCAVISRMEVKQHRPPFHPV